MDIVDPRIERYMEDRLRRFDEPVLLEMEAYAEEHGFPIVGRNVGVTLEVLARSAGARRIMELGSGFGYSAYWHARAVGADGEVHLTDGDRDNEARAAGYLERAGLAARIRFHVGDAVREFAALQGDFDVIFNDIDKRGYPDSLDVIAEKLRPGGLLIVDNLLWSGRIFDESDRTDDTEGVRELTRRVSTDPSWISSIVPIRDGLLVAMKT